MTSTLETNNNVDYANSQGDCSSLKAPSVGGEEVRPPVPGGETDDSGDLWKMKGQPEGSSCEQVFSETGSVNSPAYLRWAENMSFLLQDSEGVALFKRFLELESCANTLDFWFACQGFKHNIDASDSQKIYQLIKVIYRTYIRGDSAVFLQPSTKKAITERLNRKVDLDQTIFDDAQCEMEELMRRSTYPAFLKSDIYIQYVSSGGCGLTEPQSRSSSTSTSTGGDPTISRPSSDLLQTVEEDRELSTEQKSVSRRHRSSSPSTAGLKGSSAAPLTTENLIVSCRYRTELSCVRRGEPVSNSYAHGDRIRPPNPYHISYAPVSTQDSEMQSLSSEAHTDDTLSQTDSSLDGAHPNSRKHWKHQRRTMRRSAQLNRDSCLQQMVIPRTDRDHRGNPKERNLAESDPSMFAMVLTERLDRVVENQSKMDRIYRLVSDHCDQDMEGGTASAPPGPLSPDHNSSSDTSCLLKQPWADKLMAAARASSGTLQQDAQSILEDHCSRIWEKSAEETPAGGTQSPGRTPVGGTLPANHAVVSRTGVGSTASFDSGVTPDFYTEHRHVHHYHYYHHLDNTAAGSASATQASLKQGTGVVPSSSAAAATRSTKTSRSRSSDASSNIDSGVSMVYDKLNPSNDKVLAWIMENEKSEPSSSAPGSGYKRSPSTPSSSGLGTSSSVCGLHMKHPAAPAPLQAYVAQQATVTAAGDQPRQPMSQAPLMPPLPPPDPTTQLEEAKRRLLDCTKQLPPSPPALATMEPVAMTTSPPINNNNKLAKSRSFPANSMTAGGSGQCRVSKGDQSLSREPSVSNTSTLSSDSDKAKPVPAPSMTSSSMFPSLVGCSSEALIVGYYLCGDPVPYRTQWSEKDITLGQFKQLIAKRGSYRYFFKKACDEFDTGVVHEEVVNEDEVLPLWEGKIVAIVEKMD